MTRLPLPDLAAMAPEQRRVHDHIVDARGGMGGPYVALLRTPELAEALLAVGDRIRFASALPERVAELAIIVTARHWETPYAWVAHSRLAVKAGLDRAAVDAIGEGRAPTGLAPDEQLAFDFCTALVRTGRVSDDTYAATVRAFGEDGVVTLTSTVGFYCLISLVLNVDDHPAPGDRPVPF